MLNWGLLALLVAILLVQVITVREAFGSSQGGAQVQLAASRPAYFMAAVPV
jgi:hypothetical protein